MEPILASVPWVSIDMRAAEMVAMAKSVPALDPGSNSSSWSRRRSADAAGQFALVEALVPQRVELPPQVHTQDDEAYYIMEGNLAFTVGGKQIPGDHRQHGLAAPGRGTPSPSTLPELR